MKEVLIDGVPYFPLQEVVPPSIEAFRRALLAEWFNEPFGPDDGKEAFVYITDNRSLCEDMKTIDEFVEDFASSLFR